MQPRKPSIQLHHLLRVLPLIIILLPIPRLLVLPLLHNLRSGWSKRQQIGSTGHKHPGDRYEHVIPILPLENTIYAVCGAPLGGRVGEG